MNAARIRDPLDRLILISLTTCMERLTAMSAEVDNLASAVSDVSAVVSAAVGQLDALAAKVASMPSTDPADASRITGLSSDLLAVTQALRDALARTAV